MPKKKNCVRVAKLGLVWINYNENLPDCLNAAYDPFPNKKVNEVCDAYRDEAAKALTDLRWHCERNLEYHAKPPVNPLNSHLLEHLRKKKILEENRGCYNNVFSNPYDPSMETSDFITCLTKDLKIHAHRPKLYDQDLTSPKFPYEGAQADFTSSIVLDFWGNLTPEILTTLVCSTWLLISLIIFVIINNYWKFLKVPVMGQCDMNPPRRIRLGRSLKKKKRKRKLNWKIYR